MKEKKLQDEEVTRRSMLKTACAAGAGTAMLISGLKGRADASGGTYPQVRIANVKDIKAGKSVKFDYPLAGRKNILIDCGCSIEEGVGPQKSIVAYSSFCTHLGCGVDVDRESGMLVCECHQTVYDPKQSGKVLEGPAPCSLPMVMLDVDKKGDIYAVGVAGLIYGLRNNLLDGEVVK